MFFFQFKSTEEINKKGGCKGGELPFIYKTLDLDCVETVRFKNIDFVAANSGMRCDVNLKMTFFLRDKQFCIAFKSTFCYFVMPCTFIWIPLLPSVTHVCLYIFISQY